jgi:polyhydroxybutyrate depolymerase
MRSIPTSVVTLLLVSSMVSGCVSDPTKVDTEEDNPVEEDPDYEPNISEHCIEYDELERCWLLLVPLILNESAPAPLLVDMHGNGDDMYQQRWTSDFANISMEQGFFVAYPQGHNNAWNHGSSLIPCSDELRCSEEDDVGFTLQMLDTIMQNHSIDKSRVYVTGWSNGCGMTQRLAVQASEVFAAAGCMAMYRFAEVQSDYSPIPFMEVHGLLDEIVLYATTAPAAPVFGPEKGAIQNLESWADLNGCQGSIPEVIVSEEDYDIRGYTDCENEAQVMLVSLFFAAHNPYEHDDPVADPGRGWANPTGVPSSTIVWEFVSQFSKKSNESIIM